MTPTKILITGATGFIGTRLCERLSLHYKVPYRALVRTFAKATRIARLNAEMAGGDLMNAAAVREALKGCDAVVHLAHADDKLAVKETGTLLQVCQESGVKRFVHVSSMAVHGPGPGPETAHEETARIGRYGESYFDSKAEVEELVQSVTRRHGPATVILRPTIVYGPHSTHVVEVVAEARKGDMCLIDNGSGICNAVYVDDVCGAIWAGLTTETGVGMAFFINGNEDITWKQFIETFARMVEPPPDFRDVSSQEVRAHWEGQRPTFASNVNSFMRLMRSVEFHKQLGTVPAFGTAIRAVKSSLVSHLSLEKVLEIKAGNESPPPLDEALTGPSLPNRGRLLKEMCMVRLSNELAREKLGWVPRYNFRLGSELTGNWLAFARLLTPPPP
jgi:dihydroflavonol-4-reductase